MYYIIFTSFLLHSPSRTTYSSVSSLHSSPFCCTRTTARMKPPVHLLACCLCLCACLPDSRGLAQRQHISERHALETLRSSLRVRYRHWSARTEPCSNWTGVVCIAGRVQSLDLTKLRPRWKNVTNSAPHLDTNALLSLTELAVLNASGFPLPGPVPAALGSASSLTFLSLARTNASGSIPPNLGNLSRLTVLDLSGNSLHGTIPGELAALRKLETLNLSNNHLSGTVPRPLGGNSLKSLDLSFNSLDGALPDEFFSGHNLSSIKLDHNHFSSHIPDSLWKLPNLVFLDVSNNNLTGKLEIREAAGNGHLKGVALNLSHNLFYGNIPSQLSRIMERYSSADLSSNYFEGNVSGSNVIASMNCFRNLGSQRPQIECDNFYMRKDPTYGAASTSKRSWHWCYTPVAVACGLAFVALLVLALMLCAIRYRAHSASRKVTSRVPTVPTEEAASQASVTITVNPLAFDDGFSYEQLVKATSGFSSINLIKNGHTGDLHYGLLEDGVEVVVKRIDLEATRREVFLTELNLFETLSGVRLVPFLGCCLENEKEKLFVYNYMPNGDLHRALRKKSRREDGTLQSLDWIKRLKIASGIAEALCFLHHECNPPLVHRDIEASSILLDDKYEVRLGSLSEVCAQQFDVHQNFLTRMLRPQISGRRVYSGCSTATCAYDIYCMGKVLLELVTGKLGISGSNNSDTNKWVEQTVACINIYDKGLVCSIVDPSLVVDEDHMEEVWAVALVAKCCLDPRPARRPLARHVLQALQSPLKVVREVNYPSICSSQGSWHSVLLAGWLTSFVSVRSAGEDKSMSVNTKSHSAEQDRPSSNQEGAKRDCPE